MNYIPRNINAKLLEAISYQLVALLDGVRQMGKSTLVEKLAEIIPFIGTK